MTVEWDFDGAGRFADRDAIEPAGTVQAVRQRAFGEPGTHFPVVRAVAQREGDAVTPFGRLQNLARVRVVVDEHGGG